MSRMSNSSSFKSFLSNDIVAFNSSINRIAELKVGSILSIEYWAAISLKVEAVEIPFSVMYSLL